MPMRPVLSMRSVTRVVHTLENEGAIYCEVPRSSARTRLARTAHVPAYRQQSLQKVGHQIYNAAADRSARAMRTCRVAIEVCSAQRRRVNGNVQRLKMHRCT